MTNYQQRWIEILDRRYHLVQECPLEDFWLELARFLDFIVKEEPFLPYIARLRREFSDWIENYTNLLSEEVETVNQIREELANQFPDLDDSDVLRPEIYPDQMDVIFEHPYFDSLANFDYLVEQTRLNGVSLWSRHGRFEEQDPTEIVKLIRILNQKILNELPDDRPEDLFLRLQHLSESHAHLRVKFIGDCRVWPPAALEFLLNIRTQLNPAPERFDTVSSWLSARVDESLQTILQIQPTPSMDFCRVLLRRFYERVRTDFGTHLAHDELIQRYKARCMFYDRERVIALANDAAGHREDALTRDMALYLFDNGLSTFYRALQGVHEYDLISPTIAIEAKIYRDNRHRRYLVNGVSQLHAYMNGLEADTNNFRELYFVVFRLDGPLYDWPEKIEMNRWTIYLVTIDLGSSEVSGSRQSRVKPITVAEIMDSMPNNRTEEEG